jgi:hypothetical protein
MVAGLLHRLPDAFQTGHARFAFLREMVESAMSLFSRQERREAGSGRQ